MIKLLNSKATFSFLKAVSPLDGRYHDKVAPLSNYFSESALMKYRIIVESQWLLHMLENKIIPEERDAPLSDIKKELDSLIKNFDTDSAERVK